VGRGLLIPGHGEPSGKASVREFGQFLAWIAGQVRAGMEKGMTLPQIQSALVPFQKIHWHAPELESEAVTSVYRLLVKQKDQASSSAESTKP